MTLFQIAEPGQTPAPHERRRAVGIDLGTTNSLVATVRDGRPECLPDADGRVMLPSLVHYTPEGAVRVGEGARLALMTDPEHSFKSIKRLMGRSMSDVMQLRQALPYRFESGEGVPRMHVPGGSVTAVQVSSEILRALRGRAEAALGGALVGAVITVPAYFDEAQRQATRDAARLAGLHVLRLLNEPTAAAVAYGLDRRDSGTLAVFDLGGGTFDISILRLSRGVFEVLATGGDSQLGGDDFDEAVACWILDEAGIKAELSTGAQRHLQGVACQVKERLTEHAQAEVRIELGREAVWSGCLSCGRFNELIDPLVDRTLRACRRALRDAGLEAGQIDEVVMVGGATRVPRVRERVAGLFGREPLTDIDPDRVVALGAALQADVLAGNKPGEDWLLLDVIPLSLGIETLGGLVERLIPRNTTLPVARAQEFTTFRDGQTAMALHVVQGERERVEDCRSLARFELRGIPPMAAGAARIRVTFQVDADGLLTVSAVEASTGVSAEITVKPSHGLAEGEIERMLRDSVAHAAEDMQVRRLREARVEGERVRVALEAALSADAALVGEDGERITAARIGLDRALAGEDVEALRQATAALEQACAGFVERRMNQAVARAMKGHAIDRFAHGREED